MQLKPVFMKRFVLLFVLLIQVAVLAQKPIDTIKRPEGTMLIYPNRTWEYLEDKNFDGILNHGVHQEVNSDSAITVQQKWTSDKCYSTTDRDAILKLKDTIWLCVTDTVYDKFVMPFDGLITSRYGYRRGRRHNGIDIDLETGDSVRSAFAGKVRYTKYTSGFGNVVIVRHHNGLETFYAHLEKVLVVPNQLVDAGDIIGLGGNTGRSTGSHLHFEVRFYDQPIDPEYIIDFKKKHIKDENLLVHKGLFHGTSRSASSGSSSSSSSSTYSKDGKKYHKIRSGDSLYALALRNKTTVDKICKLNGIKPTTILRIGKTLRIR